MDSERSRELAKIRRIVAIVALYSLVGMVLVWIYAVIYPAATPSTNLGRIEALGSALVAGLVSLVVGGNIVERFSSSAGRRYHQDTPPPPPPPHGPLPPHPDDHLR